MDEFYRMAARLIRYGRVSSVDAANRTVKVFFPERDGMVSGDLTVLQRPPEIQEDPAGEGPHTHNAKNLPWMPTVGQMVLCIYLPSRNGDGFVIGAK